MRRIDFSFASPAENLACDEVLSDRVEQMGDEQMLRFWESPTHFVVVGVGQVLRQEVREEACAQDGVPVLRRCSAGGAVLQGPGCLNFTLVLLRDACADLQTIRSSYCHILGRIAEALQARGTPARHRGVSDLAVNGLKISGNAQKRRRRSILHHGTLLYAFDAALLDRYLFEPADQPAYRRGRPHAQFVMNLPLASSELKQMVCEAFGVSSPPEGLTGAEQQETRRLAAEKYLSPDWIYRR